MGLQRIVVEELHRLGRLKPGRRMFELGNQNTHVEDWLPFRVAKDYFVSIGIDHVSLDWNGQDGALKRSILDPIDDLGTFDLVTNFGSSEHVSNQAGCFRAFHQLCAVGGVMVHSIPLTGHWPNHGDYWYESDFLQHLCTLNGYSLLYHEIDTSRGNHHLLNGICVKTKIWDFLWSGIQTNIKGS